MQNETSIQPQNGKRSAAHLAAQRGLSAVLINEDRMVSISGVIARVGVSRGTIYRWINGNTGFPKPRKLGPRRVAWSSQELSEWIATRAVAA